MQNKNKKPFGIVEGLIVAAVVLCLAAAAVMISLFVTEATERTEADSDYQALEEHLNEGVVLEVEEVATPQPTVDTPEEETIDDDTELLVILHNEALEAEREGGATALPMTPAPTAAPSTQTQTPAPAQTVQAAETAVSSIAPDESEAATPTPTPTATPVPTPTPTPEGPRVGTVVMEQVRYTVDFDSLLDINEDVVAWLIQDGTEINYPVVQGEDNTFYLNHLYTGRQNKTGAIFVDCGNSPYFTDMVSYLYGHNRKDGAMFASLPEYQEQAYFEEHPSLMLITPYEDYRLEVFACIRASVDVKDEWHTKTFDGKEAFDEFVKSIEQQSMIDATFTPEWGDRLLAMCTCTNEVHEERYIVFTRMSPIAYETEESVSITKMELDDKQGVSGYVNVPGRGQTQYYAQNDPVWASMRYEPVDSGKRRTFGDGGCGPTSMAMVAANLVADENLWWLSYYSGREQGLTFCTCSVNQYYCNHRHAQYKLETPQEFRRYLPVAVASFATGNNIWKEKSRTANMGTKPVFMKRVAEAYALSFEVTKDSARAQEILKRGGMAVVATGGKASPFTNAGHFIALAGMDDEYLYILDPFLKDDYSQTDKRNVLEVVEPGLLKAKLEDWDQLCLYTYYLFESLI